MRNFKISLVKAKIWKRKRKGEKKCKKFSKNSKRDWMSKKLQGV